MEPARDPLTATDRRHRARSYWYPAYQHRARRIPGGLRGMLRDGVVDAVEGDPEREAAFWFLTCGVSLVSLGWSFRRARRQTGTLPSFVGPALLGIATAGVTFMPRSGFWAVFVAAILAYGERHQQGG